MALGAKETESILSFCATGKQARAVIENGRCAVSMRGDGRSWRFEGATFEDALRAGADAGQLRRSCIEKQISFWSRNAERPRDVVSRILMTELGAARGRIVEREIVARLGRPLSELTPVEFDDVASAAELVLGARVDSFEAARVAKRILVEARGALGITTASPRTLCDLGRRIARLVHETQKERGETAVLLGSDGRRYVAELGQQRAETDRWLADLGSFTVVEAELPPGIEARVSRLREMAAAIAALRADVDGNAAPPNAIIDSYTELNAKLLEAIDAIAADAPEHLRVLGVAFSALMWAKESTGRERAHLAVAFGRDRYAPGQIFTVGALFGAQESFLRLFTTAAPRDIVCELNEKLAEPPLDEARRLEAIALSRLDGGFDVDPTYWYEAITRKIDAIDQVGGELADRIARRAEE